MSNWVDVLRLAAQGEIQAAIERTRNEVPLALRWSRTPSGDTVTYDGPVMNAVRGYAIKCSASERALLHLHEMELVDTIVDDVLDAIDRSIQLVGLVRVDELLALDDLVLVAPWAPGLKRDRDWKAHWLADMLRSLREAGISLSGRAIAEACEIGIARMPFDEVAFAADPKRVDLTWRDLKRSRALGSMMTLMEEESDSAQSECADHASVRMAQVAISLYGANDMDMYIELRRLGRALSLELTDLLEAMHEARPKDGYQPIAWHSVFWAVESDYEGLNLDLDVRAPYIATDAGLSDHLHAHFPDVRSTSRPMIVRRRKALYEACEERILGAVQHVVCSHAPRVAM